MPGLAQVLRSLHETEEATRNYPFNDRIFVSVLLCLAAGERNLILRVGNELEHLDSLERTEWVNRIGQEVAWICSTAFFLTSHRVNCNSNMSVQTFLRHLFLPGKDYENAPPVLPAHPLTSSMTPARVESRERSPTLSGVQRTPSRSMTPSRDDFLSTADQGLPRSSKPSPRRTHLSAKSSFDTSTGSTSPLHFPSSHYDDSSAGEDLYPDRPVTPQLPASLDYRRRLSSSRIASGNITPTFSSQNSHGDDLTHGVHGLGFGSAAIRQEKLFNIGDTGSSMYDIGDMQRGSSQDKQIGSNTTSSMHLRGSSVRDRNIPMSTVKRSTRSKPKLTISAGASTIAHTSGNSPTAGSPVFSTSPVSLSMQRRGSRPGPLTSQILPQIIILEHLETARPSVQQALLNVLRERRFSIYSNHASSRLNSQSPMTSAKPESPSLLLPRRKGVWSPDKDISSDKDISGVEQGDGIRLPDQCIIIAIVCEGPGKGKDRQTWGGVSRYLLDYFSYSQTLLPRQFTRHSLSLSASHKSMLYPSHPLVEHSSSLPLSSARFDDKVLSSLFLSDSLENYIADLVSTLRHHPLLESRMLTAKSKQELAHFVRVWVILSRGIESCKPEGETQREVTVLPADVLSVLLGIVGHRLKMRAPSNEKSTFWGSKASVLEQNPDRQKGVEGVVRTVIDMV